MGVISEPGTPPRLLRRSFTVFLIGLVLIVLAFLAVFGASLYEAGRNNAVSKATALEQYVGRSLEVSGIVARDALEYLHRRGSVEGLVQDREAHLYFADLVGAMRSTEGMIFVNRDGTMVVQSGRFPAPPVDLSDRAWFRAHVEGADTFIDGSFVSRVTGTLLFVRTFAMRDDDGALLGVVNIGISSNILLGPQALPFDDEGIVTEVFKETGQVIARDPFPEDLVGSRVAVPEQLQEDTAVLKRGTDGRLAVAAYRHLPEFDLVASVSVPLAVLLQPLMMTAAITLPLLALIVVGALVTLRHLKAQQKQLARSAARLETVLQTSNLGAWQWLPKPNRTDYLGCWAEMLGYSMEDLESGDSPWEQLLHPDEREHLLDSFAQLLSGEKEEFHEEHRMRHKDGHWIWVLDSCRVVERDAEGRPEIVIGIHFDISERRDAEERMRTISLEVDHRSKNLLAVVQSLVSMTKFDSEETFKTTLRGRIQALSRAHELLSRSRWRGADLRVIAEEELGPYISGRAADIVIEGPRTFLGASSIQALAMALHELATNAAKHGALADPEGRLRLTWCVPDEGPHFKILWEEFVTQVPPEHRPGSGFGTRLMRLMIETQLGGKIETDMRGEGLRCRMLVPKELLLRSPVDEPAPDAPQEAMAGLRTADGGRRILIVEDEALVAAETTSRLEAAGHEVVATASSVPEANSLAADADVEVGILDLNLDGELAFPVADMLLKRGIPFVFLTGYQPESVIPRRFAGAPVLRKPCSSEALESALSEALTAQHSSADTAQAVS